MAIQNRRGIYSDFDPTKMVEGEFAVVQSGDPDTIDGKSVYISTQTGSVERVALYKDVTQAVSTAIDEVTEDVIEDINEGVAENVERAETAADNAESSAEEAAEILENKADIDGTYDNLVAGNLLSDAMQTDTAPYLFRPTGGGLQRIGERCYPVLVGASVGENQLVNLEQYTYTTNGVTYVRQTDGSVVLSGTATDYSFCNTTGIINSTPGHKLLVRGCPAGGSSATYCGREGFTSAPARRDYGSGNIVEVVASGNVIYQITIASGYDTTGLIFKPQLIDLTMKFGSAIADYVYQLETATAGSGIAWLRSYDLITDEYKPYNTGTIESVEATAKVVRDENNENAVTYPLGSDVLRGIFKLDANNKLYADGDRKESDGTITRRYGVVDLGTVNWAYSSTYQYFETRSVLNRKAGSLNLITAKYVTGTRTGQGNITDKMITSGTNDDNIVIRDLDYTDAVAFKNALSGVYLVYELATPTTETSTPFQNPQICDPDGTEEYVTENGVPVGHETEYPYDLKGLVEELIDVPEVPSANGTYVLKATRTADGLTYNWSWVAE